MTTPDRESAAEQITSPLWAEAETTTVQERATKLRQLLVHADDLARRRPPPALVDDFLFLDSLAWLQGKPGVGKSFLALDVAGCVATGIPWHGRPVAQGSVLYVLAEGDATFGPRVNAWQRANRQNLAGVTFLPTPLDLTEGPTVAALVEIVRERQPSLVVIDTQARVTVGADENSSKDMGRLIGSLDQLRVASGGGCILTLHHEPRNAANLRGSTALEGAANTIVRLSTDRGAVKASCVKQKDAAPFDPFRLALRPIGSSAAIWSHKLGAQTAGEIKIIEALRDNGGTVGLSSGELEQSSGLAHSTFHRAMGDLRSQGLIVNEGHAKKPRWVLAESA